MRIARRRPMLLFFNPRGVDMSMIRIIFLVLAAALAGCSATAQDRSTGQVVDDAALTAKVKASIAEEDGVSTTSVNVTTYRGTVQLSGFVETEQAKRRAENAARDVEGVREVHNDLRVAPAGTGKTR
jgi:osmotically-inducible protein OsmY